MANHSAFNKHSDELLYFTQSVINMENKFSRKTKDQNAKTYEEHNPRKFPNIRSSERHEWDLAELRENVLFGPVEMKQSEQASEDAEFMSFGFEDLGVKRRMTSTASELVLETTPKKSGLHQHSTGPMKDVVRELEDNVIWTPSRKTHNNFKSGLCNITLSRIYFARDEVQGKNNQVPADDIEHNTIDPGILDCLNQQPNNKYSARQRNEFMNKIIPTGGEIEASSLSNSVSKSRFSGGMFHIQAGSECKERSEKRPFSKVGGNVYILPDCQAESLSCDEYNSDARIRKEHSPREKRSKIEHVVSDKIVIDDEEEVVSTSRCVNRETHSTFMQVVADSEGRILVNFAETAKDERRVKFPKPIIVDKEEHRVPQTNNGDIGRTSKDSCCHKDHLRGTAHSSKTKHFVNQTVAGTCYQTSALITNDSQWDSWKRTNCIPCDGDGNKQRHPVTTVRFCDREEDENNSDGSKDKTPRLKKIIRTTRQSVPEAAMQNSSYLTCCDANISKNITYKDSRCERSPKISNTKYSRNSQYKDAFSNKDKRCVCLDKQFVCYQQEQDSRTPVLEKPVEVSRGLDFETKTQRCPLLAPKTVSTSKRSGCQTLTSEITIVTEKGWEDPSIVVLSKNNDDIQAPCSTQCSTPSNKSNPSIKSSNGELCAQPTIQRQNNNTVSSKTGKEEKRDKKLKEKCGSSDNCSRYLCDWPACEKSFRHYSFLVLHKRIHTGERPYICSWKRCSKQFRRSDDYQRHYRVHTGLKPYVCTFCGKGFKRSDHRLFHYRAIHNMKESMQKRPRNTKL